MLNRLQYRLTWLINLFYKNSTIGLFLLLPAKVTKVFISLSILALVYEIKCINYKEKQLNAEKFKNLLDVSFNEDIMLLPSYTVHWFWKDKLLNKEIKVDGVTMLLKDLIFNDKLLFKHLRFVIDILLENIPDILKFKLNLSDTQERLAVRHNVMNLLIYS